MRNNEIKVGDFIEFENILKEVYIAQVYEVRGTSISAYHDKGMIGFDTELTQGRYTILSKEESIYQYQKKFKKLGMYIDYTSKEEYVGLPYIDTSANVYEVYKLNLKGMRINIALIDETENTVYFDQCFNTKEEVDLIFELHKWVYTE